MLIKIYRPCSRISEFLKYMKKNLCFQVERNANGKCSKPHGERRTSVDRQSGHRDALLVSQYVRRVCVRVIERFPVLL